MDPLMISATILLSTFERPLQYFRLSFYLMCELLIKGVPKIFWESIKLCEYTFKTRGKKGMWRWNFFFNGILVIVYKFPLLLNLNPKFQVLHGILNHAIFSQIFQGYLKKWVHSGSKSSLFDCYLRILFGITMLCTWQSLQGSRMRNSYPCYLDFQPLHWNQ